MQNDVALELLLPELNSIDQATLWLADENALSAISSVNPHPLLTIVTNRYDIYQLAKKNKHTTVFTDFNTEDYSQHSFTKIVYRVSKEKALVNFLLNQACQLLASNGELIISGYKQDGIKSYSSQINKVLKASGKLKKKGICYLGKFSNLTKNRLLGDQDYPQLQKIIPLQNNKYGYSKPGVFGWNKIDQGTSLLLAAFDKYYHQLKPTPKTMLDIGCGYGWIALNMDQYKLESITATDNNAAALISANKNATLTTTNTIIKASDCGNTINEKFDLVLCNPPFHQGFKHDQKLIEKFLASGHKHLKKGAHGFFVVNEFIPIESISNKKFEKTEVLTKENGFKVVLLKK
ncbi:MAG: methyltransferase [Cellvibrionaceae bacterium]